MTHATMSKPVLMIHEMCDRVFDVESLDQYILTFDDALYTQYLYLDVLAKIRTEKYFFISTGILADVTTKQSPEYIDSATAHNRFRANQGDKYYMNWDQIRTISQTEYCYVGGHSHSHTFHETIPYDYIVSDTNQMIEEFKKQLEMVPDCFCFPYNKSTNIYAEYLARKGFINQFGAERIDINELL